MVARAVAATAVAVDGAEEKAVAEKEVGLAVGWEGASEGAMAADSVEGEEAVERAVVRAVVMAVADSVVERVEAVMEVVTAVALAEVWGGRRGGGRRRWSRGWGWRRRRRSGRDICLVCHRAHPPKWKLEVECTIQSFRVRGVAHITKLLTPGHESKLFKRPRE